MICKNQLNALFIGFLLLTACGNGDESETAEANTEGTCAQISPATVAERTDTLNIIIETSGSMKGFMPTRSGQTQFQEQIDDLLANAEGAKGSINKLRLYTAQDNIRSIGYDRFQSMLRQGLAQAGASTPIPNLLRQIASQYSSKGQVSVFISDFIYSPPNARDRDYISNDIRRALAPLQQKGLVVAVHGFQSEFQGTFYPAGSKNGGAASPVPNCCDTQIPYYVWIIGTEPAVRMVSAKLLGRLPQSSLQMGFNPPKPGYEIIPGSGRSGSWYLGEAASKTLLVDNTQELRQGEVSFTVGVNLDAQPIQYTSEEFLQEHLKVQARNGRAEVTSVQSRQTFSENEELNSKDRQLLECYSHLVKINIQTIDDKNSPMSLRLILPKRIPAWVEEWTTNDDRNPNDAGARTFAYNEIIEGLRTLYNQGGEEVFALDLSIKKAR